MAIYYVDSNASGLNNGTSWTDAYADISTAIAGSLGADDYLYVASNHSKDYAATTTLTFPDNVTVVSVNSSTDAYAAGGLEQAASSNNELRLAGSAEGQNLTFKGMSLKADAKLLANTAGIRIFFENCILEQTSVGTAKQIGVNQDGTLFWLKNCEINFNNAANFLIGGRGSVIILDSCTTTGTAVNDLFETGGNGVSVIDIRNTDLSSLMAASSNLTTATISSDDAIYATLRGCKLPATFSLLGGAAAIKNYKFDLASCDAADGYHYFEYEDHTGTVVEDTVTYLNATYDGSTGFSHQFTASAEASTFNPLRYKIGVIPAQDLTTAKTITVEVTSDASLTDNDIWIDIEHNNNTDEALNDLITTKNSDPLAAGTALTTTGTGTWTSGDTEDYIITKNIGALANVDNGTVTVYGCVGAASVAANFDLPTIAAT